MTRVKLYTVLVTVLIASTVYALLANRNDASYSDVSVEQAWSLIHDRPDLVILDVRTVAEYEEGHIAGALNIPVQELEERLHELDPSSEHLVYCRTGNRSSSAVQVLETNEFKRVHHMSQGITAWVSAGYPVVT